jgi:DnaJ-class molecular chaperone
MPTVKQAREFLEAPLKFGDPNQIAALATLRAMYDLQDLVAEYPDTTWRCEQCHGTGVDKFADIKCADCDGKGSFIPRSDADYEVLTRGDMLIIINIAQQIVGGY